MIDKLREQLLLVIKGCACSGDCQLCELNRGEAMEALEILEDIEKRFLIGYMCKACMALCPPDPYDHICGDGS